MTLRLRKVRFIAVSLAAMIASFAVGAAADPQTEYQTLKKLYDTQSPSNVERGSDAYFEWVLYRFRTVHDRGLEFISTYATHPLRWDVLVLLQYGRNHQLIVRADGSKAVVPPFVEREIWQRKYFWMLEDLLEAPDASKEARHEALMQLIDYYCLAVRRGTVDNPRKGLVPALLEWVSEVHALDPRSGKLAYLYIRVARMLNAIDRAHCRAFLEEKRALHPGKEEPDPDVRRNVENFQRLMRNQDKQAAELWAHLQQIDPTLTDLSPYRGKVVLIAYLAVDWTSQTMELEELYGKYHEAGLEIIQIASHNRNVTAPLLQRDKEAMERHVAEKKWPWRVLWDTSRYPNYFYQRWAQNSIPCFLFVGRDGRLVREIPGELRWDIILPRELFISPP